MAINALKLERTLLPMKNFSSSGVVWFASMIVHSAKELVKMQVQLSTSRIWYLIPVLKAISLTDNRNNRRPRIESWGMD